MNELLKKFLKSPLAIGLACTNALLAVGAALSGIAPTLVVLSLFVIVTGGEMTLLLASKPGAKAILAEQDRERNERDAEKLLTAAALRKRLSLLRIDDAALKTLIDKLVLASGLYLDACTKGSPRDPFIEDSLAQASNMVNEYLKISDSTRIEQFLEPRGGTDGSTSSIAPVDSGVALVEKTRALLDESVREIEERLALPQGGLEGNHTARDAMESRQELEE